MNTGTHYAPTAALQEGNTPLKFLASFAFSETVNDCTRIYKQQFIDTKLFFAGL